MKRRWLVLLATFCLSLVQPAFAQTSTETASALPRLVRFGGTVKGPDGAPLAGVAGITFALYSGQTGDAPLWQEVQNVTADSSGRYTVLLGSTKSEGLPAELFTSEQAHWVGVRVQGQAELPRVLLVSAPYALKAGDAETIGGLPPSAFVLAGPATGSAAAASIVTPASVAPPADATAAVGGSGAAGYIPLWSTATRLGSSVLFQSGTGVTAEIGINTATPTSTLDVNGATTLGGATTLPATGTATATAGINSEPLDLVASAFNSSLSAPVAQTFQLRAEAVGNDTATASGALNLLYGSGTGVPAETGLKIASNGQIAFAAGQTFPGTGGGTVTSVGSGAGLTGGPITTSGALSIAPGGVGNAMLANSSLTVSVGTGLTGGGAVALGASTTPLSVDTTKVPLLSAANNFTGNQGLTGNITASGQVQGSVVNATTGFDIGGVPVVQATASNFSAGLGSLPPSATGSQNTAVGVVAQFEMSHYRCRR
jgi:hypothetical protein